MKVMKAKKVPKLRFRGFSDEWEEKKLDELAVKISDGIHTTPLYSDNGEYYFINGNNLTNDKVVITKNTKRVPPKEFEKHKKDLSSRTILMSINGTIGSLARYNNEKIVLGKSACYINFADNINISYVYNYLKNHKVINYYISELTGSTIKNLSIKTIKSTPIAVPSIGEQEKVAGFLNTVDDKISGLEKKKEQLEKYKKGVMQKIFSQKICFKGFSGKWEEKNLGELAKIKKGVQLNGDELIDEGKYPMLNGGINPSGYTDKYNAEAETITISEGGNSCGYVSYMTERFWSGGHLYTISNLSVNKKFLYQLLKHRQEEIMRLRVGSGLPNIQKGNLFKLKLFFPVGEEQKRIADFLTAIDDKIELQNKKLQQAKQFKKSLLQKMFI